MTSDEPEKLSVAELLARHGRTSSDSTPRRRRRGAEEPESEPAPEPVADSEPGSSSRLDRVRERARIQRELRDARTEGVDERDHRSAFQRHPGLRALVVLGGLLLLLGAYYTSVLLIARGTVERVDVLRTDGAEIIDPATQDAGETSLIVMSDSAGDDGAQITALAKTNADNTAVTILSFPRTTMLDIPRCGTSKQPVGPMVATIEQAYAAGGGRCSVAAIQALTGIRIDHYIRFDLAQFPAMVDAIGGVEICLQQPVRDSDLGVDVAAGTTELDGEESADYVRAVNGSGGDDPTRADRQVDFLARLFDKFMSLQTLANPVAVTQFAFAAADALTLDRDTTLGDIRKLGSALGGGGAVSILVPPMIALSGDGSPSTDDDTPAMRVDPVLGRAMFDAVIASGTASTPPSPAGAAPTASATAASATSDPSVAPSTDSAPSTGAGSVVVTC